MTQVRITLIQPYLGDEGREVGLRFGSDVIVPMNFGGMSEQNTSGFRSGHQALPSQPRVWKMSWKDKASRSVLVPIEVAQHYFGDWRATNDREAIKSGAIPINNERSRVAVLWGDYHFSNQHGLYATVKIDVPRVPHVVINNVNENGADVGTWQFDPWAFFKWEDQLDPKADLYRKAQTPRDAAQELVHSLTPEQLAAIGEALAKTKSSKAVA